MRRLPTPVAVAGCTLSAMGRREWPNATRLMTAGAITITAFSLGWMLLGGSDSEPAATATADAEPATGEELPVLPWEAEPAQTTRRPTDAPRRPAEKNGVAIGGPDAMPPASAGNNGAYTPPPAGERERYMAQTHPAGIDEENAALLVGDSAIAPFTAPDQIRDAISAANQLTSMPYKWGGGHASWRDRGYDCSGAVSYALAGAGLIGAPATSGQLMGWGKPGKGEWLTIYANPGHVYAVIAGLRWDTVGNARGEGPRWHPADAYPSGYVARHIPGL